jgi:PAS domain S-box-containing protein
MFSKRNKYSDTKTPSTEAQMIKNKLSKDNTNGEFKFLKQRISELETLVAYLEQKNKQNMRFEDQKYKAVFESANDIMLLIDIKGNIIDINPRAKEIGEYEKEELIGKHFRALPWVVTPKSLGLIEENFVKRMAGINVPPYEIELIKKNGEVLIFEINANPVKKNSYTLGDLVILRDVTARKRVEEKRQESDKKYRLILENTRELIFILDSEGTYVYVSPSFRSMLGYDESEIIGKPFISFVHPEDFPIIQEEIRRSNNSGFQITEDCEYRIQHASGDWLWYLSKGTRVVDNDGKFLYFIGVARDVTERKQVEQRLEHAAQEWRATFDSITDFIFILDKDNRIRRVNMSVANMLKTTPKDMIGKLCQEVMHGTKEPPPNCPHLLTLKTGKPATIETFNPDLGIYLHESTSPFCNENAEVVGSIIVARDVTIQKRIEEQLILTDRLATVGEWSSGIAHELNNPLTSIIGFSQLLLEDDITPKVKEDLNTIYSEAQRAAKIVKNLLTFARKHTPVKQICDVNIILEDALRLRDFEHRTNNIEVIKHFATDLPSIMVDQFQMQQVFLNIVVNAEFAMLEAHYKGKLNITTEVDDDFIKITFADDGPGISKENIKHIFDPFFTTKDVGKGTGLGLSICHGIVTEHGGKIYAKSENGQGATFYIELPLSK